MPDQEPTLTAAGIRYLLAINELTRAESGVKGSDIAKHLGVTKPSVHTMMKKLCEKGYTTKEKYEAVHLTELGKRLAEKYARQYALLYGRMEHSLGLTPEGCRNAACAILSQTVSGESPEEKKQAEKICKKITLKIDGMMCGMCEAHMNDAMRNAFPVKKVASSHTKGLTEILTQADIPDEALKGIIDATGYTLVSVTRAPFEKKGLFR